MASMHDDPAPDFLALLQPSSSLNISSQTEPPPRSPPDIFDLLHEPLSSPTCLECGDAIWHEDTSSSTTKPEIYEDLCLLCLLSKQDPPSQPSNTEEPSLQDADQRLCPGPACSSPDDPKNTKRAWGDVERTAHRQACIGKKRLTLQEKAEIIQLYYRAGQEESPMKQMTIAETYGKSRAAISKLLRPENAHRVMVRFAEKKKAGAKGRPGQRGRGRTRPGGKQGDRTEVWSVMEGAAVEIRHMQEKR
ncbi:hypothetical protein GUITHDRAFT_107685 [Guillardia theta CCMP2712]|uniref:Uncharacterized protein n=1 Tax=Guillardia theta (strain CCMP2712) TaxID=905079 RepID=L1JD92_GUITC|nr:hypothetical protein GUITHDRAFT_107685 [Guillardia theta CCMP2712]EKX46481.1 hypothetical protein GUITHDRAFT_107685 [Guillardia theta CCMP2712]|eukprot:XP_005833461.1 hypothetical protein GUITHDRAFT_107685 [Guillardia theta CCMP2712]